MGSGGEGGICIFFLVTESCQTDNLEKTGLGLLQYQGLLGVQWVSTIFLLVKYSAFIFFSVKHMNYMIQN